MSKKEKVAKAMARVLENRDWSTFETRADCPECGKHHATLDTHRFCPYCGQKKGTESDTYLAVVNDLYAAFQAGKRAEKKCS